MGTTPLARSTDLIVDGIGDELLVYDTTSHRAHSLNNVGSAVWQACDGTRSPEEIAAHTGLDPAAVELALDNLADIDLISGHQRTGISRRTALRRITVGAAGLAVALPIIRSLTAPTAAMAVSACTPHGDGCRGQTCCAGSYCAASGVSINPITMSLVLNPGVCRTGTGKNASSVCTHLSSCHYGSSCDTTGGPFECKPF
jgi:hypothetical protein